MRRMFPLLWLMVLLANVAFAIEAPELFVNDDNTTGPWTGTQAYPFQKIQDAIDTATTGTAIRVSRGVYSEQITLRSHIELYGGYPEDDYATESRDPNVNVTTITNNSSYTTTTLTIANVSSTRLDGFRITREQQTYPDNFRKRVMGIYCRDLDDSNLIYNCNIEGVRAITTVGGPRTRTGLGGGGISCYYASPRIVNCTIKDNHFAKGGGIYLERSSPFISKCIITSNGFHQYEIERWVSAYPAPGGSWVTEIKGGEGAGIFCYFSSPIIENSYIVDNHSEGSGGGISASDLLVQNCLIYGNSPSGYVGDAGAVINCIIWNNSYQIHTYELVPSYSCIQDWTGGGEGNISEDPRLLLMSDGTYRLTSDSPCIDAGKRIDDLTTDYQGQPRGFDGTPEPRGDGSDYDIGADEYTALKMLTPNGGERFKEDEPLTIHWQSEVDSSGTAVFLELWRGGLKVADLGDSWNPAGDEVTTRSLVGIPPGGVYRVRATSLWNADFWDESDQAFTILPEDYVNHAQNWQAYR